MQKHTLILLYYSGNVATGDGVRSTRSSVLCVLSIQRSNNTVGQ